MLVKGHRISFNKNVVKMKTVFARLLKVAGNEYHKYINRKRCFV